MDTKISGIYAEPTYDQLRQCARMIEELDDATVCPITAFGEWLANESVSFSVAVNKADEVLGFIAVIDMDHANDEQGTDLLDVLFVNPKARRAGIGRALVESTQQDFDFLNLYVEPSNTAAKQLYLSLGFKIAMFVPHHGGYGTHLQLMKWQGPNFVLRPAIGTFTGDAWTAR